MKNLFHLVTARAVPSFLNFNGENISGDGIILSDMEFGIHTLSSSPFWKFKLRLRSLFLGSGWFSLDGTFM